MTNQNSLEIGGLHQPHHLKTLVYIYLQVHLILNLTSLAPHLAGREDVMTITCEQSILTTTSRNCLGQGVEVCWCAIQLWGAPWQLLVLYGELTIYSRKEYYATNVLIALLHFQVDLSYTLSWNMHYENKRAPEDYFLFFKGEHLEQAGGHLSLVRARP